MTPPRAPSKPPIDWRASVRIPGITPLPLEPVPEHHQLMMDLLDRMMGEVKVVTGVGLPETSDSPFRDRLLENGSEVTWFGMDDAGEPSRSVVGEWHDEPTPKPRREPFPNPEPMAYRPKW